MQKDLKLLFRQNNEELTSRISKNRGVDNIRHIGVAIYRQARCNPSSHTRNTIKNHIVRQFLIRQHTGRQSADDVRNSHDREKPWRVGGRNVGLFVGAVLEIHVGDVTGDSAQKRRDAVQNERGIGDQLPVHFVFNPAPDPDRHGGLSPAAPVMRQGEKLRLGVDCVTVPWRSTQKSAEHGTWKETEHKISINEI